MSIGWKQKACHSSPWLRLGASWYADGDESHRDIVMLMKEKNKQGSQIDLKK
jgi:hypothetical protein